MTMKRLFLAFLLAAFPVAGAAEPMVYVAGGTTDEIFIIDAATDRMVGSFQGLVNPHGLVASPDGRRLVAASLKETRPTKGTDEVPESALTILDPERGIIATVPVIGMTHHLTVTPDGRYVFSTHPSRGYVTVLDLEGPGITRTIETGEGPNSTVITRDGATAYVSNGGDGTLSQIDIATWKVTRTLEGGPAPEHLALSPDEKTIYTINARAGAVAAVDLAGGKVVKTFAIGRFLHGMDVADDGRTLIISSKNDNKLVALDPMTGARKTLTLAPQPYHLAVIRGTGKIYVSSIRKNTIWVVDQETMALIAEIPLPGQGHQMAVVYP